MASQKSRFKLPLPRGWEDQTAYTFMGPVERGVQHILMMILDRHLQHTSVRSFAREKVTPILSSLQGVEILKDEEVTIPGGNPVYEFVYKWIPGEGNVLIQKYVFVFCDGIGFTFSARFSKTTLKTVGLQMPRIIEALLPGTYEPVEDE